MEDDIVNKIFERLAESGAKDAYKIANSMRAEAGKRELTDPATLGKRLSKGKEEDSMEWLAQEAAKKAKRRKEAKAQELAEEAEARGSAVPKGKEEDASMTGRIKSSDKIIWIVHWI